MGNTYSKVTYKCDCGKNYGSCDVECEFYEVYNRTCDIAKIYHKDCEGELKEILCLSDNAAHALANLLSNKEIELTTEEERNILKQM